MKRKIIQLIYNSDMARREHKERTFALCNDGTWWMLCAIKDENGRWVPHWEEQTRMTQDEEAP